jgi:negative regulator of sigma E activity
MKPTAEQLEQLSAYLDGELPSAEREMVERMLAADAGLRRELESLRRTADAVRTLPRERAPAGLADDIASRLARRQLLDDQSRPAPAFARTFVIFRRLAVAAVFVLAVGVGWRYFAADDPSRRAGPDRPAPGRTNLNETGTAAPAIEIATGEPTVTLSARSSDVVPPTPYAGLEVARKDEKPDLRVAQVAGASGQFGGGADESAANAEADGAPSAGRPGAHSAQEGAAPAVVYHAWSGGASNEATDSAAQPNEPPGETEAMLLVFVSSPQVGTVERIVSDLERRNVAEQPVRAAEWAKASAARGRAAFNDLTFEGTVSDLRELVSGWQERIRVAETSATMARAERRDREHEVEDIRIEFNGMPPTSIMSSTVEEWSTRIEEACRHRRSAGARDSAQMPSSRVMPDAARGDPMATTQRLGRVDAERLHVKFRVFLAPTTTAASTAPTARDGDHAP